MATRYDVRFLAAAIKANYLNETKAKELFDAFAGAGASAKGITLADFAKQQGFLSASQVDILERVVGNDPVTEKKPASRIGPYEPLSKLGAGGMGVVVKARHAETGEIVALKILPRRLYEDPEYIQRFVREANNSSKLNHPNIMRGLGANKTEDGLYYYAMEYIDGESVQAIIDRMGSIPESQAIAITIRVARALEHAQEHTIVHRDIKPENIMINRDGKVKLTDLGLAKEMMDSRVTQTGIALGTPHYMSPEQARGDKEIDIRSDIYSLGATLYHLLTGQPPFVGRSAAVVITKHLMEQVPSPQEINPEISSAICKIIARMMAKEQDDRYLKPQDLIQDLERVARGEEPKLGNIDEKKTSVRLPVSTAASAEHAGVLPRSNAPVTAAGRSVARTRRARREKKRNMVAPALSLIIGALLLVLVVILLTQKSTPTPAPKQLPQKQLPPKTAPRVDQSQDRLRGAIQAAKKFETENETAAEKQDEIVARWEKLLTECRGTNYEREVLAALEAAKIYAATVSETTSQGEFEKLLASAQEQATLLISDLNWLEALGAFDALLARSLSAEQSQLVARARQETAVRIVNAVETEVRQFPATLNLQSIEKAQTMRQTIAALKLDGLSTYDVQLSKLISSFNSEQEKQNEFRLRATRAQILDKVVRLVGLQEFDPAEAIVAKELALVKDKAFEKELRNIEVHVARLAELWKTIHKNAITLVGETMNHLGFEGKVTAFENGKFVLGDGRFKKPLHSLKPETLLELATRDRDTGSADVLRDSAIFWLYRAAFGDAEKAMDRASQKGVDLAEFRSVYRGIKEVDEERAAQKLYQDALKDIEKKQWKPALIALAQIDEKWSHTAFARLDVEKLKMTNEIALREGRAPLLNGRTTQLADGFTQIDYDFSDPKQINDWRTTNHHVLVAGNLSISGTNWLVHRAEFSSVSEIYFEVQAPQHFGEGHANVGWAVGSDGVPPTSQSAVDLKSGLIGRIQSQGRNYSSVIAPGKLLQDSLELQFRPAEKLRSRLRIEGNNLRWVVNDKEFIRYSGIPALAGTRVAIFSEEAHSVFNRITIKGNLQADWEKEATERDKVKSTALKLISDNIFKKSSSKVLDDQTFEAWWPARTIWTKSGDEIRFAGGQDVYPLKLPIVLKDFTVEGRFQHPENATSGWRLGLRTNGALGYFVTFDPGEETIALSKVTLSQDLTQGMYEKEDLASKKEVYLVAGSWQSFKAEVVGEEFSFFLDNQSLLYTSDQSFTEGHLSISGVRGLDKAWPVSLKDFVVHVRK